MSFAILGYGRFGRAFGTLLSQAGMPFKAYDPTAEIPAGVGAASATEAIRGASWVVLAMPIARMEAALQEIRKRRAVGRAMVAEEPMPKLVGPDPSADAVIPAHRVTKAPVGMG